MKRIFLSYILALSAFMGAMAAPVTRNAALVSAKNFLSSRGVKGFELTAVDNPISRSGHINDDITTEPVPYHIFNLGDNNGFIVVAGDDRARTILGYSLEGELSLTDDIPEACKAWLETYVAEIASLPVESSEASNASRPTYSTTPVPPLLTSKWDQKDPYNLDCPMDLLTNQRSATGCVATATAQVMYYYRYPERGTGSITYEDKKQSVNRSMDFASLHAFDWQQMTDTYGPASTENERAAVANLMSAVAFASKMQFSSETSIAYNYAAAHALIDYFGYDPSMHFYERALTGDQEWIDIITAELEAGRPVIYNGSNPTIGHAFVCDGHDGNGFFHFNWGWSGLSDGYFSLSALNPDKQSTGGSNKGYTHNQSVICNIAPKGSVELSPQTDHLLNIDKLYFRNANNSFEAAQNQTVESKKKDAQMFFYSFNKGLSTFTGEVCAAIVTDGSISPLVTVNVDNLSSNAYAKVTFNLSEVSLADGTHRCAFYYRKSENDSWHRVSTSAVNTPSECYISVNGDNVTFTACLPDINVMLWSEINMSRLFTGTQATWTFDLLNSGSIRFEGYAGVALINKSGEYAAVYSQAVLCPSGETQNIEIKNTLSNIQAGTYTVVPFISYSDMPDAGNIIPLTRPTKAEVENIVIIPDNGSTFIIDTPEPSLSINVTNLSANEWTGKIEGEIVKQDGAVLPVLFMADVHLEGNGRAIVTMSAPDLKLEKGTYKLNLYVAPGRDIFIAKFPLIVSQDISGLIGLETDDISIVTANGCILVKAHAPVKSYSLYDLSGRLILCSEGVNDVEVYIITEGLPRGVYILTVNTVTGTTVTRKLTIGTH